MLLYILTNHWWGWRENKVFGEHVNDLMSVMIIDLYAIITYMHRLNLFAKQVGAKF